MLGLAAEKDALSLLLDKVYRQGGYDFRDYKRGTVSRRLEGRLHATGARDYPEYMDFLDAHPEEYQKLADYLTVRVSGFFRDPYAFEQISRLVLPELFSRKEAQGKREIKLWSAACACGEEPYSIAIMLAEFPVGQHGFDISIHATDISRRALAQAETGVYSAKDLEGLSLDILRKYFNKRGESYEVNASTRQMVSFSPFDLTSTARPPFSGVDCIFCCNVLIYLQRQLQERVLGTLYDSLAAPGYLVLGEVETPMGTVRDKLEYLDNKAKIYKKVA